MQLGKLIGGALLSSLGNVGTGSGIFGKEGGFMSALGSGEGALSKIGKGGDTFMGKFGSGQGALSKIGGGGEGFMGKFGTGEGKMSQIGGDGKFGGIVGNLLGGYLNQQVPGFGAVMGFLPEKEGRGDFMSEMIGASSGNLWETYGKPIISQTNNLDAF